MLFIFFLGTSAMNHQPYEIIRRIYVRPIAHIYCESQIVRLFSKFGAIKSIYMPLVDDTLV